MKTSYLRVLGLIVSLSLMVTVVFSQQKQTEKNALKQHRIEQVSKAKVDKLDKKVGLTPDQRAKVLTLRKAYYQKRSAIKVQYPDDMVKRVEEYKKIEASYESEIGKILTSSQLSKRKQKTTMKN